MAFLILNSNLGNRELGSTLTFYAQTIDPATGNVADADAAPAYRIYEEETGTPIVTGSMALLDDVSTTGFYSENITLSTGNGYDADKDYCIRLTATVLGSAGAAIYTLRMGAVPADMIEVSGDSTAADKLEAEMDALATGTADSGSTSTVVDAERTEADTDYWKGSFISFTGGTLAGQTRLIIGFTPASDTITFFPATTVAVAIGHTYVILPSGGADVELWRGLQPNSLVSGSVDSSMELVDGDASAATNLKNSWMTGAAGANLVLSQLRINSSAAGGGIDIDNSGGPAISATSASTDQPGMVVTGNGTGAGLRAVGGATGPGVLAQGGSTSGDGVLFQAEQTTGVGAGATFLAHGNKAGIESTGGVGAGGHGAFLQGGGSTATGSGLRLVSSSTGGHGLHATSSSTSAASHGIFAWGQSGGDGMRCEAGSAAGSAGGGLHGVGTGAAPGIRGVGGATGHGLHFFGGTTSGDGMRAQANGNGQGVHGIGGATSGNSGIQGQSGVAGHGIYAFGDGAGHGIKAEAGATGHGLLALGGSTSGDGFHLQAQTSGDGMEAIGAGGGLPYNPSIGGDSAAVVADAVWDEARVDHVGAGSFGQGVLVASGGITAASIATNAIDSDAIDATAATEIGIAVANEVWDEATAEARIAGSYGQLFKDNVNATISSRATDAGAADAVWDEARAGHVAAGSFGQGVNIAAGGITSSSFTAGSIDAAAIANDAIDNGSIASGAISSSKFASGAITAAVIATNAIDADAMAADAVIEILGAVTGTADSTTTLTVVDAERTEADTDYWKNSVIVFTAGPAIHQTRRISAFNAATDTITVDTAWTTAPGNNTYMILRTTTDQGTTGGGGTDWTAGEKDQIRHRIGIDGTASAPAATPSLSTAAAVAAVQADTDNIQTRIPAALVSGRMDSSVGAMAAGVVTATAIATGAVDADAIATDAVTEIQSGLATAANLALVAADAAISRKYGTNRRRLVAALNQLELYDDNGTTVLYRFDTKDSAGAPSTSSIFELVRV